MSAHINFDVDGVLLDFWTELCNVAVDSGAWRGDVGELIDLGWDAPREVVGACVPLVDYANVRFINSGIEAARWAADTYPGRVRFMTSCPPELSHHYKQKRYWLDIAGLSDIPMTLVSECKSAFARPGWLLFDDLAPTVLAWNDAGGNGVQVPCRWSQVDGRSCMTLDEYKAGIESHMGTWLRNDS